MKMFVKTALRFKYDFCIYGPDILSTVFSYFSILTVFFFKQPTLDIFLSADKWFILHISLRAFSQIHASPSAMHYSVPLPHCKRLPRKSSSNLLICVSAEIHTLAHARIKPSDTTQ